MMFSLIAQDTDDEDEWTGPLVTVAKVDGGKVTGKMASVVKFILATDSVRLGIAGQSVKMDEGKPWLVAYALTMRNGELLAAGVPPGKGIRAFTPAGEEIPMPKSYLANLIDDVIMEEVDELARPVELSVTAGIVKAGRNAVVLALTALDAMPATNGKIPTPWNIGERPTLDPEAWEASKIETVPIAELTATQRTLNVETVRAYVKNPGSIEENRRALANVYANYDGLMIVDGHHRLAALWLLGADNANVWFLGE
jgi:hypothetical protein